MPVALTEISIGEVGSKIRALSRADAVDEWGHEEFEVATGVTASSIFPANITTIAVLYFESSQDVTIFLNSSATAIPVNADGIVFLVSTAITALTITNASGNLANIDLGWFGT